MDDLIGPLLLSHADHYTFEPHQRGGERAIRATERHVTRIAKVLLASHALHEELGLTGDDCATIALVFAEASLRCKAQEAINKKE